MTLRPPHAPVVSLESLRAHWSRIGSSPTRHGRSLWLMFHDEFGELDTRVIVIDDLPLRPEGSDVHALESIIRPLLQETAGPSYCIVLLSRPGTARQAPFEQDWAEALRARLGDLMTWPICRATPHGIELVMVP